MVSKVLCFAFLVCILVQFLAATAKPANKLKSSFSTLVSEHKNTLAKQWDLTKETATNIFGAAVQGVKTVWKMITTPYRFGNGIFSNLREDGLAKSLRDSATKTVADNGESIKEDIYKHLAARKSLHTSRIEAVDTIIDIAKSPITLIKKVVSRPAGATTNDSKNNVTATTNGNEKAIFETKLI